MPSSTYVSAWVYHGGWSAETRAHPATKWFEEYTAVIDSKSFSTPAMDHHTADFTWQMSDGTVIEGADKAWAAVAELHAPFSSFIHEPISFVLWETDKGWDMIGEGPLYANLQGAPGELKFKDAGSGKSWETKSPGMYYFEFVKGQGKEGIALKSSKIYADSKPALGAMLKKGVLAPEQLMQM